MGVNMAVFAEGLCLGSKAGIPVETMIEVLKTTGAASRVMETRGPNITKGDYKAQFMMKLIFKDMGLALDTAASDSIPMPISGLVRQIYAQAIVDGRGEDDYSAIVAQSVHFSCKYYDRIPIANIQLGWFQDLLKIKEGDLGMPFP
jgi:3-hydroxyisobutyrate dehydrogenase-like beta-hydroxyacid dehydrogenase